MRNHGLDAAKAVAAYFVILLHIRFPGRTGEILNVLARFAVPFFFMVSGYFCYSRNGNMLSRMPGKIMHVLSLIAVSYPFYFVWQCMQRTIEGKDVEAWASGLLEQEHILDFLKYNYSLVKYHLWFLPALLYCYLLFAAVEKLHLHKAAYLLIPVLLVLLFRMEAANITAKGTYRPRVYRNYLYTGFPFFMLGHLIHRMEPAWKKRMSVWVPGELIILGAGMSIAEYWRAGVQELFVGSVFLAAGIFLASVKNPGKEVPKWLAEIGRRDAFFIYLFHLAIADMWMDLVWYLGIETGSVYQWTRPFAVCILTTFGAVLMGKIRNLRKGSSL